MKIRIVIDIGNTNIKYGIFKENKLLYQFKQRTVNNATSDEIGLFICQFLNSNGFFKDDVDGVIISSVVPQIMFSVKHSITKYFNQEPIILGKNLNYDFSYISSNKEIMSAPDRLIGCYYVNKKYPGVPSVILDFGTATTFDVINEKGNYLGGVILPGVRILSDVLTEKTAQLPKIEIQYPETLFGVNTVYQMQAGIIYGYIGSVKNIINELKVNLIRQESKKVQVVATGGLSTIFYKEKNLFDVIDKTLILDGLNSLYNEHESFNL